MANSVNVYMVGHASALKTNQWEAMTNDWSLVEAKKKELGPGAVHKVVKVPTKPLHKAKGGYNASK
jgi:hypothetical protein